MGNLAAGAMPRSSLQDADIYEPVANFQLCVWDDILLSLSAPCEEPDSRRAMLQQAQPISLSSLRYSAIFRTEICRHTGPCLHGLQCSRVVKPHELGTCHILFADLHC